MDKNNLKMINIFQPSLGKEELNQLDKVFKSNWIGKGPQESNFKKAFANKLDLKDSELLLTTTSCTEGIFLAPKLFGLTDKDEIIIPTISFPSVVSSFIDAKVKIAFCDVDIKSLNPTVEHIKEVYTANTRAIFLTHYGGVPIDMDPIIEFCKKKKIYIFEDAACSVDSFYKNRACGTLGDYGVWSFDAMKTLTTGDGGMIFIKDPELRKKAEMLLYLGLPLKEKSGLDSSKEGNNKWWEYSIELPGRRAIMNDISATIGLCQLKKLNGFIESRKKIFEKYQFEFQDLKNLTIPSKPKFQYNSSYYFYWIQTKYRDRLAQYLVDNGIYCTFRYYPVNHISYFKDYAINGDKLFPNTELIQQTTLNIPIHQLLTNSEVDKIITNVKAFIKENK